MAFLVTVRALSLVNLSAIHRSYRRRSAFSESYVILWFLVMLTLAIGPRISDWLVWLLVGYRMIDAVNYRMCILFVDRYKSDWGLRSLNRSLIILLVNYLEIVLGFAALYRGAVTILGRGDAPIQSAIQAVYFSFVTITTLGYGDFFPVDDLGRAVISAETMLGVVLVVLVFGSFVSGMKGMDRVYKADPEEADG